MISNDPGELRSRIIIEKVSFADNGFGGMRETWSTMATVWAKKDHLFGNELVTAQQVSPSYTDRFKIRYRSDISTNNRIKYGTIYYNIIDIEDIENMHDWLYLKCEVRKSGQ